MRRARVVRSDQVKIEPFVWKRYLCDCANYHEAKVEKNEVSKKKLKAMADEIGLMYDEEMLRFSKKLINYYLNSHKT